MWAKTAFPLLKMNFIFNTGDGILTLHPPATHAAKTHPAKAHPAEPY
jgi:hypothetical protein